MPTSIFYNHSRERISELAEMISRQGYNMVRFHFFDKYILASSRGAALKKVPEYKLPETSDSIVFDAKNLDTFFYFINELKKRGIYTNLDLMTSYVGYDNGEINSVDRRGLYNTKIQMFVNPMFRNNWKAGSQNL